MIGHFETEITPLGGSILDGHQQTGLWEVRSTIPEGIARVLFTVFGADMVLLHGFIKKSNSTPKEDLELARTRMKEVKK